MTVAKTIPIFDRSFKKNELENVHPNQLLTNEHFATFTAEIKKPETGISGLKSLDSGHESSKKSNYYDVNLPHAPNLYKNYGASVFQDGVDRFIKLPRDLLEDPNWRGMRIKYQRLFLIILEEVSYKTRIYKYNGNSIEVKPGQLCVSYRRLAEIYNRDVRYQDEKITVPLIQRAVSVFFLFGFAIHESIHGIMRITITQRELYEHFKSITDTPSDIEPIQNRYTNEERKKERSIEETNDRAKAPDSLPINLKIEEQQKNPSVFDPQESKVQKDLSSQKQQHFGVLWKFIVDKKMDASQAKKPGIKEKDVVSWLKTYDGPEIMECLKATSIAEIQKTFPGYVTKLLKDKIPKRNADSIEGRKIVQDFINLNKINYLELKADYFKDLISNEQSYYYLPKETLNGILKKSLQRFNDQEEQERRQREYENSYE